MNLLAAPVRAVDGFQRRYAPVAVAYAVAKKFSDDQANLLVVSLGWYGFLAIYPLLLVIVTIFGFIGVESLGTGLVNTLEQFPVIGSQVHPGPGRSDLHGNVLGLVIGVAGLLYGSQGVTQVALRAMSTVWNVPKLELPGFLPRLGRSFVGLLTIGGAFVVSAFVGSLALGRGHALVFRVLLILTMAALNFGFYLASFVVLTPKPAASSKLLWPGALFGAISFTLLTTLGTGLIEHQLRNTSATYGAFASIIGVVTYLLLVAKLSIYGAVLNPVLARRLWPRALVSSSPTEADRTALRYMVREEKRRPEEQIDVRFADGPGGAED